MACAAPPGAHGPARTAPETGAPPGAAAAAQCLIAPAPAARTSLATAPTLTRDTAALASALPDSLIIVITGSAAREPSPGEQDTRAPLQFVPLAALPPSPDCGAVRTVAIARISRADSAHVRWRISAPRYAMAMPRPGVLRLAPTQGDTAPALVVQATDPQAARDALDAGASVLVTGDPDAVAYARSRADLESVALPWDRSWVLVVPTASPVPAAPGADSAADSLRGALAAGAVREDARASNGDHWWNGAPASCVSAVMTLADSGVAPAATTDRVAYREGDTVARELAERLVALAAVHSPALAALAPSLAGRSRLRAAGLTPGVFARAMASGRDVGYILPLPARAPAACQAAGGLSADSAARDAAADSRPVIALVDTRAHVIVRRGTTGLAVDSLGAFTLLAPAPARP